MRIASYGYDPTNEDAIEIRLQDWESKSGWQIAEWIGNNLGFKLMAGEFADEAFNGAFYVNNTKSNINCIEDYFNRIHT